MMIPKDYLERVYAGVLGKIIGVYLGRPIENWSHERIAETFGEIDRYVHEERGRRLVVTDDDISGTFTFLRALEDSGYDPDLTPAQIGEAWLNYIIEGKTILWWGGMGNSTEHTAYLRLKHGIEAPASGAIETNGKVTAEQIGAQIFIDGWGLVCPSDPARAADFARRAASVSHDGEAVYGAQIVAALVASAFVERDIDRLLDLALAQIPTDCTIRRLIDDLRAWRATGETWRESRARLEQNYGYDKYPGVCHIVPNHGLVILALLHGAGDFDESLK
ncbi:ADP-ribosylglycohydrolase family protein, partial [bacterium]